jgi:RNA polymerase sigma factor (sigma-70 family)
MSGKHIVPLQYRSEQALVSAAIDGDDRAIEQLVISHPPIRSIITTLKRRLDPGNRAQDDLEGTARLAVLEALRAYKPERGARFSTYAYYFVRGAMLKTLYPSSERYRHNGTFQRVRHISLEAPGDADGEHPGHELELLKNDADYGSDPEYATVENAARDAEVRHFISGLPDNQRTIVSEVFWSERTHGEVAVRLGTSRPAVTRTLQRVYARGEREIAEIRYQLAA